MSSLTALFGNSADKSSDDEKLMNLYWKRNELKKEFAMLRNEKYRLQDQVKHHQGAIARIQQKLDHLEELLIDPEWARSALVHYQLRGMNQRCQRKLARFAEQLKQQREQKQQSERLADWQQGLARESKAIESQIFERHDAILELEDQLKAQNRCLEEMGGVTRLFKRRAINAAIDELTHRLHAEEAEQEALKAKLTEISKREPPETAGLDIATKRSINFTIIAFAQQLYILFGDDELVSLVKEAGEKSAGAFRYGNDVECEEILKRIRTSTDAMEKASDFADVLQQRAKLIADKATFRTDNDAVPVAGTVATLYRIDSSGLIRESDTQILGDNYWGIAAVLSR